jgi:apolipoprotein N-acyltransferase
MAIMRGVEGGYAVVRTARLGYLTATDAAGRIVAGAPSAKTGFVAVRANVPLGPGGTIYVRIGDIFAWLCVLMTIVLFAMALVRGRRDKREPTEAQTEGTVGAS